MLWKVNDDGTHTKMQIDKFAQCGLFQPSIVGDEIHVSYIRPKEPVAASHPKQDQALKFPLEPDTSSLDTVPLDLHLSMVDAYRMDEECNAWFSACFGFPVILTYIGDKRRPILGTYAPDYLVPQQKGWLSTLSGYVTGSDKTEDPWIGFTDLAPLMVATEKSYANVKARVAGGDVEIWRFRPNIVVDGDEEFDEDFWNELSLGEERQPFLTLTKMCNRCNSLNIDYNTGRVAEGESGTVLKKLMSDRRVDKGAKWSPVFGKYAFLAKGRESGVHIAVGDEVTVTKRSDERPVFDWPIRKEGVKGQYYQYT